MRKQAYPTTYNTDFMTYTRGLKKRNRVHIAQKPAQCENIYIYLRPLMALEQQTKAFLLSNRRYENRTGIYNEYSL